MNDTGTNYVELPPGEMIRPSDLVEAIVHATFREKTDKLSGMECISGKLVTYSVAPLSFSPDLASSAEQGASATNPSQLAPAGLAHDEAGSTPEERSGGVTYGDGQSISFPYELTEGDRRVLEPLLARLPPLSYPMSSTVVSAFVEAYLALPERPSWVPTFVTEETINQRLLNKAIATEKLRKVIRKEIEEGRLIALNHMGLPARELVQGTSIPRHGAMEYLKRYGLSASKALSSGDNESEGKGHREEGIYTKSGDRVTHKDTSAPYLNAELEAIEEFVEELHPITKKKIHTRKTAARLVGVSPGRITQLLNELKRRRTDTPRNAFGFASQLRNIAGTSKRKKLG